MIMNALGETCPVCGGRMRQSQYSVICAQEFGPCGLLFHRKGRGGRSVGGVTQFEHTKFKRSDGKPWTRMRRHYKHAQFYAAGREVSEDFYMMRIDGGPVKPVVPGKRAVVIVQGEVKG